MKIETRTGADLAPWLAAALFAAVAAAAPQVAGGQTEPRPAQGQIEEEDLAEPAPEEPAAGSLLDEAELLELFAEAEEVFRSEDRLASLPLFGQIVDRIESHLAARIAAALSEVPEEAPAEEAVAEAVEEAAPEEAPPAEGEVAAPEPPELPPEVRFLSDTVRSIFVRSLGYRAEVQLSFGESELAESGLERMLATDPDARIDRDQLSEEATELFDRVRRRLVGDVSLNFEPPQVEVRIDGRRVEPQTGPVGALAGSRWLTAERPGYRSLGQEIEVEAGRQSTYDLVLERIAPVIRLHSRPPGAEVVLDGGVVGTTEGTAPEGYLSGGRYRPDEFSAELVITDVELGLRVLELRKEGYRTYRAELSIEELIDYPMPPIVLAEEAGVLVFRNLPAGARVLVDGAAVELENRGSATPQVALSPGEHEVQVASGAARMFSETLLLADRQTVEIDVRLRPGLVFLGVLGGRASRAESFAQSLKLALADSGKWALLDRPDVGRRILAAAGLGAGSDLPGALAAGGTAVRSNGSENGPESGGSDWKAVQRAADRDAPGLLYVAAVLPDDLLGTEAQVLIWPAAPGPAVPDVVSISLSEPGAASRLQGAFAQELVPRRPWFGALVIETDTAPHPIVAHVTPGSPAEAAGLAIGDQVVGVDRRPVLSRGAFDARIAEAAPGDTLELALQSAAGVRTAELRLGSSPWVMTAAGSDRLDSITFIDLDLMAEEASPEEVWVIRLNQALILLRASEWEEAARRLRAIEAPQSSHGVSQAAVDYWLGVALAAAGAQYRDTAQAIFDRASRTAGARLLYNDEAFLAPRARARLVALGGS